jgi:hypothetical protein
MKTLWQFARCEGEAEQAATNDQPAGGLAQSSFAFLKLPLQ